MLVVVGVLYLPLHFIIIVIIIITFVVKIIFIIFSITKFLLRRVYYSYEVNWPFGFISISSSVLT